MMKSTVLWKLALVVLFAVSFIMSCDDNDGDLSLNDLRKVEIERLADSVRLRDSLSLVYQKIGDSLKLAYYKDSVELANDLALQNAAGQVNYTAIVVNASASSFFAQGRSAGSQSLDGATVTVSQFGKRVSVVTDASGLAAFKGFLRGAISVTIVKNGFTSLSFTAHVPGDILTPTDTKTELANIIPIFELTGTNTATLKGRLTIETDLTNKTAEIVPEGTAITAAIDASHADFADKFFRKDVVADAGNPYTANIYNAVYTTNIIGSTNASGEYTITLPAAVDGLPMKFEFSQVAATQKLFQSSDLGVNNVVNTRTIYGPSIAPTTVPSAGGVTVGILTGSGATATANIKDDGKIERVTILNGGRGYVGTPKILIDPAPVGGVDAAATATVTNGVITGITLMNAGLGYTSAPVITVQAGSGAAGTTALSSTTSVLSVSITNSGSGYTTPPNVTFATAPGSGTTATGTANISNGKVSSITITNAGSGYNPLAMPSIAIDPPPAGGTQATAVAIQAGSPVDRVLITSNGSGYSYAPAVLFSAPQVASGVRAEGVAIYDANIGGVVGVQITNPGSGYTADPSVTFDPGSGAALQAKFVGRGVLSVEVTNGGAKYTSVPEVTFTSASGSGAAGTAVIVDGQVVAVNITNAGSGYDTPPTVGFISGQDAAAYAVVDNGKVTEIRVVDGGFGYTGAPVITLTTAIGVSGSGGTATATVANGAVTGITVTHGGGGYIGGNTPSPAVPFSGGYTNANVKPGITYIHDPYYGTGARQN